MIIKRKHRPDTPPPGRRPPTQRCEWTPIDWATNSWGLMCPWCGALDPMPFPETPREADEVRRGFEEMHLGCSGKFPLRQPPSIPVFY